MLNAISLTGMVYSCLLSPSKPSQRSTSRSAVLYKRKDKKRAYAKHSCKEKLANAKYAAEHGVAKII